MLERFDDSARRAVVLAQEESRKLSHHTIGTEHLLLGLLREDQGIAARTLSDVGITYDAVFARTAETTGWGATPAPAHLAFTEPAKQAIEGSLEEATALGHSHVGAEHILLGLLRDENEATGILTQFGVNGQHLRERVVESFG